MPRPQHDRHCRCCEFLGHRSDAEQGPLIHWPAVLEIGKSIAAEEADPALFGDAGSHSGGGLVLQDLCGKAVDRLLQPGSLATASAEAVSDSDTSRYSIIGCEEKDILGSDASP